MTAPDPQPPAAPETDVSEFAASDLASLTEAHRDSHPMGNIHHGTPERPDWGTFCVECTQSWPCDVSRLLADLDAARERVRVVEGERDEYKRGWVEADVQADEHAATSQQLARQFDEQVLLAAAATARAESAEAAHRALQAAVEALCDPANDGPRPYAVPIAGDVLLAVDVAHLRALLAGGAR